ncbi:MAG: hypothetical protein AAGD96_03575 [Chloroflexota bacterium]
MSNKKETPKKDEKDPVEVDATVDQVKKVVDRLKKIKKDKKK